jgi:hypothetical protein
MHPISGGDKKKFQFKYNRDFEFLTHLPNSGFKFVTKDSDVGKGTKPQAAHRRMMVSQLESDGNSYYWERHPYMGTNSRVRVGDQLYNYRVRHRYLPESIHEKENIFTQVVEVTVPGDPKITVGSLIKLKVPQPTITEDDHQEFLRLYGQEATFLITAIRNMYIGAQDVYYMVLSCSAESFGTFPEGKTVLPGVDA